MARPRKRRTTTRWLIAMTLAFWAGCAPSGEPETPSPPAPGEEDAPEEPEPFVREPQDPQEPGEPQAPEPREPGEPGEPPAPRPGEPAAPGDPAAERPPLSPDEADGELVVATTTVATVVPAGRQPTAERIDGLRRPPGFEVELFADGLENPRIVEVTADGHIYVTEREAGRVTLLRDTNGDGRADHVRAVAEGLGEGLSGVHGLAARGDFLFMVTEQELWVAEIRDDGALGEPQLLVGDLPHGGQHPNRTVRWGPDGMLYLSVGSTCNACREPDEEHATLLRFDPESGAREVFARGLRNTIGFDWHPGSGRLFGLDHNTDERGDDWPPEELNLIEEGAHYGWPHCGGEREVDPLLAANPPGEESREAFCERTEAPVLTWQAHAAPMQMVYYDAGHFPPEYQGDAFATMRGSWNRNPPVGYEIVRIRHDGEGNPDSIEPFVSGWLIEEGRAHFGRLTGLAVTPDGSLLVSDDENGVIYRIRYGGVAAPSR